MGFHYNFKPFILGFSPIFGSTPRYPLRKDARWCPNPLHLQPPKHDLNRKDATLHSHQGSCKDYQRKDLRHNGWEICIDSLIGLLVGNTMVNLTKIGMEKQWIFNDGYKIDLDDTNEYVHR